MKNSNLSEFCLGDRKAGGTLLGISAQVSDVGVLSLITLPGLIYAFGAGQAWLCIGLFLGCIINWQIIPYRLLRYSLKSKKILTISDFLSERFKEKNNILKFISSIFIAIMSFIIACLLINLSATLLANEIGISAHRFCGLCILVVTIYTVYGGMRASIFTDFFQGIFVLAILVAIPIVICLSIKAKDIVLNTMNSGVPGGASVYLNVMFNNGEKLSIMEIISQIAWGIAYMGMPQILTRFMAAKDGNELNRGRRTAIIFSLVVMISSCVAGALSRAYLYPQMIKATDGKENGVLIEVIKKMFLDDNTVYIGAVLFLFAFLCAAMSVADSQLLVIASTLYNDIIKGTLLRRIRIKNDLVWIRVTMVFVALCMYIFVSNINVNTMELLNVCWMILGCSLGPVIFMSLYWRRMNKVGALAGIISGVVSVCAWTFAPVVKVDYEIVSLYEYTGINAILPAVIIICVVIFVTSKLTWDVSEEVKKEFDDVKNRIV